MPPPTIVFDLDGTLIDTAPDLIKTLNVVLAREGLSAVPFSVGRKFIGGGAKLMLERGLAADGRRATPELMERLFADFIAHYSDHIADLSKPFPGIEHALDLLAARQYRLAVCTNKLEHLSTKLLGALGLASRFAVICGQDTFGVQKPDPAALIKTIEKAGGDPARAVMIGDSGTDIQTAQAARIPVVAVDFGYSDRPVADYLPDRVIRHFDELIANLDEMAAENP